MSSSEINISGTSAIVDPNYRYKMPPVACKIEGRGNGIKTIVTNIRDIAISLQRTPAELAKFIGYGVASAVTADRDGRVIVRGAHSISDIQTVIHRFIDQFVLCPCCELPETFYYKLSKQKEQISVRCNACGHKYKLHAADHRLVKHIVHVASS